jgi:hypothetical protein
MEGRKEEKKSQRENTMLSTFQNLPELLLLARPLPQSSAFQK